jgi:pyrophosphate--fructose-6-phosphate 1-phosphotransferase
LWDGIRALHPQSRLFGYIDGPAGLLEGRFQELNSVAIDGVRNQGGFDLIGSSRTKIETEEHFRAAAKAVQALQLDALVVIGGDDSNTNAALLAEWFSAHALQTQVIGVPKTIDGDLRSPHVELSFGFDSACRTYSELIGNIARDAKSAKKYYHFIKLMGRSASHIALECALQTHPNLTLIGEERLSLSQICCQIADLIEARYKQGKEYGVVLLPEGLVEFIPEIKELISELNQLLAKSPVNPSLEAQLTPSARHTFQEIPEKIQKQLLLERDPHGNVQVSKIETEELIIASVRKELKRRSFPGKLNAQGHFLGYEGRCCLPTNFDANYGYCLGSAAALAVAEKLTGVLCAVVNLAQPPANWEVRFDPIVGLMHKETRKGALKPVIAKALVDVKGDPYLYFSRNKKNWEAVDEYRYPGPIQFFGSPELTDAPPLSLSLKRNV